MESPFNDVSFTFWGQLVMVLISHVNIVMVTISHVDKYGPEVGCFSSICKITIALDFLDLQLILILRSVNKRIMILRRVDAVISMLKMISWIGW